MELTEKQIERYTHHIIIRDIGGEGQRQLLSSSVLVAGLGGLGSPAALYLASAGVGTIGLIDDDTVETSNLQRQIIHATCDLGRGKSESAAEKIRAINPDSRPIVYSCRLTEKNAEAIISEYDFVIDGTDNFPAKFLINDTCVKLGKPFSHGGVAGFKGQTFTYTPGAMCLRCVFGEPPEAGFVQNCRGEGVLGAIAGIVGSIQSAEAIKAILKKGSLISNRLVTIDALDMQLRCVTLARNIRCPVCRSLR